MRTLAAVMAILASFSVGRSTFASCQDGRIEALYLFAHVFLDVQGEGGRYLSPLDVEPPVLEYKEIKEWLPEELSSSPEKIDAVAIIRNETSGKLRGLNIVFRVFAKVGPFLIDPQAGVTDIRRGEELAQWNTEPQLSRTLKAPSIGPGKHGSVVLRNIDLRTIMHALEKDRRWPYEIKVEATVPCQVDAGRRGVNAVLKVVPGD